MGVVVEFNPDLALRNFAEYKANRREKDECIPPKLEAGKTYSFLKNDLRNYWIGKEIPLVETKGNCDITRPLASVKVTESTHFIKDDGFFTKGKYEVIEVFTDNKVHFEGLERINK